MTPTQTKALEALNEGRDRLGMPMRLTVEMASQVYPVVWGTICRLIDEHEAFKQDVSDAVGGFARYCITTNTPFPAELARFIIPKPDPITEWLHKSGYEGNVVVEQAVRAFAKEQGE